MPPARPPRSSPATATGKGEETRARVLAAALALFRKRGFESTTMRDVASAAGLALGGAYYYFPSKEAIVLSYYDDTQRLCTSRAREAFAKTRDVRERLGAALHTKLDVLARDRRLLSALFKSIADPSVPMSIFSSATERVREESIQTFDEALAPSPEAALLDPAARRVLVLALWSLHMGLMLYFIHDASPKQQKTRALVDRSLDLVCGMLPLAPQLAPMLSGGETAVARILADAGLLGGEADKR